MILYLSAILPSRSETFVSNEILALREQGVVILPASVHAPERGLADDRLDKLAAEAICVYSAGTARLVFNAATELLIHPVRSLRTIVTGICDALSGVAGPLVQRIKILYQCTAGLALAHRVRRYGINHIHAHMAHVPTTIAMYTAMQLRVGFSFTGHAADLFPHRVLLEAKLHRAEFIACISHWHRRFYMQCAPHLTEMRLPIVRCGVRSIEKHVNSSGQMVVGVGRLVPKKGFATLINAIACLRDHYAYPIQCNIIGDGPERSKLESIILEQHLGDLVRLRGAMSNFDVRRSVAEATLFVLPCQIDPAAGDRDGIPVALMEAMASGVCVVTGELEPINELVRNNETGALVLPGDAASLAAVMHDLLIDHSRRLRLAEEGRRWVESEFSEATNIRRIMAAFSGTRHTRS